MGLELLQRVVDREGRVGVIEADHEPDTDLVLAHRVDEAAAELVPLRRLAERPSHRVNDPIQGLLHLPDLLDAQLPPLREQALELEVVDRGAGEMALGALGQDGRLGHDVRSGLEVRELLAISAAALVPGAHAPDDSLLDQQLVGRGLGQQIGARLLGLLAEEAAQLRDRRDVVAVIAEVGRHGLQGERLLPGQQVDRVLGDLLVDGPLGRVQVGEELPHRRWAHVGPRHQVRARDLALLDHRHRNLAELLGELGLVLQELHRLDRACEPGRAAPDDGDADLDPIVLRIGGLGDVLLRRLDRRRKLGWRDGH